MSVQERLLEIPLAGLYPVPVANANALLERWGRRLGPVHRPFRQEGYLLELDGAPLAVAVSASIVNGPIGAAYESKGKRVIPFADKPEGFARTEVVELARLAAAAPWASRIMLRLWREVCAPRWGSWSVRAAVSYSHNAMHPGDMYRFDGWQKVREDAGSGGGGLWSRKREQGDAVYGRKTLWVWRYGVAPDGRAA